MRKLLKNVALLASTAISAPAFAETDSTADILDASIQACYEEPLQMQKAACLRDTYDSVIEGATAKTNDLLSIPTTDDYHTMIQQQDIARLPQECPVFEKAFDDMPPTKLTEIPNYFINIAKGCAEFSDAVSKDTITVKHASYSAPIKSP